MEAADFNPDPIAQFHRWLEEAVAAGVEMPEAMTLATADAEGRPRARTVLLKSAAEDGFRFFPNTESRKGPSCENRAARSSSMAAGAAAPGDGRRTRSPAPERRGRRVLPHAAPREPAGRLGLAADHGHTRP